MLIAILCVIIGFILLIWSADQLVEHASILASNLGISALLVGIIVIGFGTSAPELFVSAIAAMENKGNLALGNALGSNITNIGLVLGSAAVIGSFNISRKTARQSIPFVIAVGIMALVAVIDGHLSRIDGSVLMLILIGFLVWSARDSQEKTPESDQHSNEQKSENTWLAFAWTVASIIILVIASRVLVYGATTIATQLGVSELIIGLTVVAIGTSLPELAAAVAAARKNVHEMIIGNIVGSNIFNTLGVLGITGMVRATDVDTSALARDFPIMMLFSVLLAAIAYSRGALDRRAGIVFLLGYVGYICYLVYATIS